MNTVRSLLAVSALAGILGALPTAANAGSEASTSQNIVGATGYIFTPDTTVLGHNCVRVGYNYLRGRTYRQPLPTLPGIPPLVVDVDAPDMSTLTGTYGLFDRVEIGGTWFNMHGPDSHADQGLINAKGLLLEEGRYSIAAGMYDVFDEMNAGAYILGQVDLSQRKRKQWFIPAGLRAGIGYGSGNFIKGLFLNTSFLLGPNIELMAEWIDGQDDSILGRNLNGELNIGVRLRLTQAPGLAVHLYGIGVEDDDPTYGGGISYTHCFGARDKKDHDDEEEEVGPRESRAPLFPARPARFGLAASGLGAAR